MNQLLRELLSDKTGGTVFRCFDLWHLGYLLAVAGLIAVLCVLLKGKDSAARTRTAAVLIRIAFGLYVADFFLMPLAYGEIDVEKLPFHVCTAMCVMCFLSRHSKALAPYGVQFAMLGFLSNLVYLIYPAGVMWHQVHPLSYRVVQTLVFHGVMTVYGFVVLLYEAELPQRRNRLRDLLLIAAMTLWAMAGNAVYNSDACLYNWFFVVRDPFYAIPEAAAPYLMPVVNIALFFSVEQVLYSLFFAVRKKEKRHV